MTPLYRIILLLCTQCRWHLFPCSSTVLSIVNAHIKPEFFLDFSYIISFSYACIPCSCARISCHVVDKSAKCSGCFRTPWKFTLCATTRIILEPTLFEILIPDPDEFFPRLDIENGLSTLTSLSAAEKNCYAQCFPTYYLWLVFFRSFYSTTSFTSPYPLCPCTILPSSGKRWVRALPLFNTISSYCLFLPAHT